RQADGREGELLGAVASEAIHLRRRGIRSILPGDGPDACPAWGSPRRPRTAMSTRSAEPAVATRMRRRGMGRLLALSLVLAGHLQAQAAEAATVIFAVPFDGSADAVKAGGKAQP